MTQVAIRDLSSAQSVILEFRIDVNTFPIQFKTVIPRLEFLGSYLEPPLCTGVRIPVDHRCG